MKFINYLQSITGIGIYPLIALFIFVLFFLIVTIYLIKGSKSHFERLSKIPLGAIDADLTQN
jgi:cytochrome c oxidase cbb3-type subunit IV